MSEMLEETTENVKQQIKSEIKEEPIALKAEETKNVISKQPLIIAKTENTDFSS